MADGITYVGMDVHKTSISVAVLLPGEAEPLEWTEANSSRAARRIARRVQRAAEGEIRSCYEAGPCGYVLQRQLEKLKVPCQVIAPSLIPIKPGERIKTDRRDARKLAGYLQSGQLTEVHPPTMEEESVRDLCRCREAAREELMRARHRLSKFLLRRGHVYSGKAWTLGHHRWLQEPRFESTADKATFSDYLLAVRLVQERLSELKKTLEQVAQEELYRQPVGWLRCFRGIDTITAMTFLAEVHDFRRFDSARHLMSYLGLTPSEHSSGDRQHRGGITKAGNSHARRVLIEAAWHYRHRPNVGTKIRKRREGQPREVIVVADAAERRLHKRYWRLVMLGRKPPTKAVVAVARELSGFLWAVMRKQEAPVVAQ